MEPLLLFAMVMLFLAIGMPIGMALGLSSVLLIAVFSNDSMSSVALQLYTASQNYTLLAIPFFILASAFMSTGGVAKRIIRFAIAVIGHLRGGLAMASVLACMLFAALSGSSPATVVAIGTIAIAGMRQVGYSKEFAAGIIANAGTLGILIPPSIVMVVYCAATNVSVGRMFLAGVVPGVVAGAMLMGAIYIAARVRGLPSEPWRGFGEAITSGRDAGWGLFLIIIIIGGIYGGVFTPTEAAAVAAVYSFFVAVFIYRDMGPLKGLPWLTDTDSKVTQTGFKATVYGIAFFMVWMILSFFVTAEWENVTFTSRTVLGAVLAIALMVFYALRRGEDVAISGVPRLLTRSLPVWRRNLALMGRSSFRAFFHDETRKVMVDAAKTTIMLMFIIVNALLFAHVLTSERIPEAITDLLLNYGFSWFTFLIAINLLLLLGGQFMEPSGLLLIVAPVVFPIAMKLGVDPVHLGIIMVVNMEIGMITPPIGLNLFVTSGITGMSLIQVVRAAMPFVSVLFLFLIIITYIPVLSTWLPYLMMGPETVAQ